MVQHDAASAADPGAPQNPVAANSGRRPLGAMDKSGPAPAPGPALGAAVAAEAGSTASSTPKPAPKAAVRKGRKSASKTPAKRPAKAPVKATAKRVSRTVAKTARKMPRKPASKPVAKRVATVRRKAAGKPKAAVPLTVVRKATGKAPVEPRATPNVRKSKVDKKAKQKKARLIRDSFTIPESEYRLLDALKKRCLARGMAVKKSEVLRAAIIGFAAQSDTSVVRAMRTVEVLKTGRPPNEK
jgi:hypothetical protein